MIALADLDRISPGPCEQQRLATRALECEDPVLLRVKPETGAPIKDRSPWHLLRRSGFPQTPIWSAMALPIQAVPLDGAKPPRSTPNIQRATWPQNNNRASVSKQQQRPIPAAPISTPSPPSPARRAKNSRPWGPSARPGRPHPRVSPGGLNALLLCSKACSTPSPGVPEPTGNFHRLKLPQLP